MGTKVKYELVLDVDEQMQKMCKDLSSHLGHAFTNMDTMMRSAYEHANMLYTLAGAPHGDSHEGLMHWLSEREDVKTMQETLGEKLTRNAYSLTFSKMERHYQPKLDMEPAEEAKNEEAGPLG